MKMNNQFIFQIQLILETIRHTGNIIYYGD